MIDYLIIGQGIAGTSLAFLLQEKAYNVHVIDDGHISSSSTRAAGIINPITGRSYVKSWRIDELIPSAKECYTAMESMLDISVWHEHTIARVLANISEENKWFSRLLDDTYSHYILEGIDSDSLKAYYKNIEQVAFIKGARVDLNLLLNAYRAYLLKSNALTTSKVDYEDIIVASDYVQIGSLKARNLVFAEGNQAVYNTFFPELPFQLNKGEVLLVKIPNYRLDYIVKHGVFICPFVDDLYWVGSGYQRDFVDAKPSARGKEILIEKLEQAINVPYEIVDHIAGVRPSVKGRKPLLGQSAEYEHVYLLGGLGTKGSSLAPYCAAHLIDIMEGKSEVDTEMDWRRFS